MGTKPKRPRDPNQLAAAVVVDATEASTEDPEESESPAIQLGRRGGKIGGKARAKRLTKKQRSDIAKHAAEARWRKADD